MLDWLPRLLLFAAEVAVLFALEVAADAFAVFDAPSAPPRARLVLTGSVIGYLRWKLKKK